MGERSGSHAGSEPDPESEWDPDIRRVTLVLDVDFAVVAMPADTWILNRLEAIATALNEIGIMVKPVRIEIYGRPLLG